MCGPNDNPPWWHYVVLSVLFWVVVGALAWREHATMLNYSPIKGGEVAE